MRELKGIKKRRRFASVSELWEQTYWQHRGPAITSLLLIKLLGVHKIIPNLPVMILSAFYPPSLALTWLKRGLVFKNGLLTLVVCCFLCWKVMLYSYSMCMNYWTEITNTETIPLAQICIMSFLECHNVKNKTKQLMCVYTVVMSLENFMCCQEEWGRSCVSAQ